MSERASKYGFDPSWSDERRRLALIEQVYDPPTFATLEQLGVSAGWRCVDVGAGGGSVARWLSGKVGDQGRVVAVDLDTRFFDGDAGIEARRLDILSDDLEPDAYDLVHCRLLLHHLRDRQLQAVRRMAASLRPGGVLVATECYTGALLESSTPALALVWKAFHDAMPNADYRWVPRLAATLQAAGLTEVQAAARADVVCGATAQAEVLCLTVQAVRERIPSTVDVDAGLARLRDPVAIEPGVIWYTAWGRRGTD